ncbi:MAG: glycerophosphodiester phosphodiesterase, partial [Spirochaetia bacterium]|nr:glycerophosphodiester phosphodiesterase [Spirochaetia bacterium]
MERRNSTATTGKEVMNRPLLFGHRGCPAEYPENTLASFAACVDSGIDGIELDVQLTKDGKLVVFHDDTLQRIANVDEKISSLDYKNLQDIDIGDGQKIPSLEQVFSLCGHAILYDIEIKAKDMANHHLEQKLHQMIMSFGLSQKCRISSFNPVSLLRFQRISNHTIQTALIYSMDDSVPKLLRKGFARHVVNPSYLKPEKEQVSKALTFGYPVVAWTVDTIEEAETLLAQGVHGLI